MNKTLKDILMVIVGILGEYATFLILSPSTSALFHSIWPETASQNPHPIWYHYFFIIAPILAAYLGGYLRVRNKT